ncbi:MAG: hypothetical protein ACRCWR_06145 [Saezia sp.]
MSIGANLDWKDPLLQGKAMLAGACALQGIDSGVGQLNSSMVQQTAVLTDLLTKTASLKLSDVVANQGLNGQAGNYFVKVPVNGGDATLAPFSDLIALNAGLKFNANGQIEVDCSTGCLGANFAAHDGRLDALEAATNIAALCAALQPCLDNLIDPLKNGEFFNLSDSSQACGTKHVVIDAAGKLYSVDPINSTLAQINLTTASTTIHVASDYATAPFGTLLQTGTVNIPCQNSVRTTFKITCNYAWEPTVASPYRMGIVLKIDGQPVLVGGAGGPIAIHNFSSNFLGEQSAEISIDLSGGNHTIEAFFVDAQGGGQGKLITSPNGGFHIQVIRE